MQFATNHAVKSVKSHDNSIEITPPFSFNAKTNEKGKVNESTLPSL